MRSLYGVISLFLLCVAMPGCKPERDESYERDLVKGLKVVLPAPFYIGRQASADMIEWKVVYDDTVTPGTVTNSFAAYDDTSRIITFRGSQSRDMPFSGHIDSIPTSIVVDWVYQTNAGTDHELAGGSKMHWYGGSGWTGQPSIVSWEPGQQEIVVGSLDGNIYALDASTGRRSRAPFDTKNPIKGSISLDPTYPGVVYAGQGIRHTAASGVRAVNMLDSTLLSFHTRDDKYALRRWGYADGSPAIVDSFLFWPAENGIIYKYVRTAQGLRPHSKLIYKVRDNKNLGIESSIAVYKTYGFIADNGGSIICFDLSTLQPLWYMANGDDTDASPVISIEQDVPYLYVGCEVDKQSNPGTAFMRKLDARTGSIVWTDSVRCWSYTDGLHILNGGMLSTPLIGRGKQKDLVVAAFCRDRPGQGGVLIAYDKTTGQRRYSVSMPSYTWSSPIAYYTQDEHLYICIGDVNGYISFIDGENGNVLIRQRIGSNFEASPIPLGSSLFIASRGRNVYRCSLR